MALLSAINRMFRTRPASVFMTGVAVGILCSALLRTAVFVRFPATEAPRTIGSLRAQGVSHNPQVLKRVLAARGNIPHIAQISRATLKPGQVASENWHRDLVEVFIFLEGRGKLQLDDTNYTVGGGHFSIIYPTTRHTIYNDGDVPLTLFTMASFAP